MEQEKVAKIMLSLGYFVGFLFIVLGFPLLLEMISPNSIYGVRTTETLNNEAIWFEYNKVAGWALCLSGAATLLLLFFLSKKLSNNFIFYILSVSVVPLILPIVFGLFAYFIYI